MSEHSGRDRHRWKTALLAAAAIVIVLGSVTAVVAATGRLEAISFLRFPLGFYLLAQGLLIGIVAVCFWSVAAQERIDRSLSESEEF